MLGKNEGKRRTGQQRMRWLGGINASVDMTLSKIWEILKAGREGTTEDEIVGWHHQFNRHDFE